MSILSDAEVGVAGSTGIVSRAELALGDVAFETDRVVGAGFVAQVACHAGGLIVGADRAEFDSAPGRRKHSQRTKHCEQEES